MINFLICAIYTRPIQSSFEKYLSETRLVASTKLLALRVGAKRQHLNDCFLVCAYTLHRLMKCLAIGVHVEVRVVTNSPSEGVSHSLYYQKR